MINSHFYFNLCHHINKSCLIYFFTTSFIVCGRKVTTELLKQQAHYIYYVFILFMHQKLSSNYASHSKAPIKLSNVLKDVLFANTFAGVATVFK